MDDENIRVERTPPSCTNCRRRKAKCDRLQPCSNCTKTGSSCSYEKVSRTPLTRKHLTDVEDELVKTKALLRRYQRKDDLAISGNEDAMQPPRTPYTSSTEVFAENLGSESPLARPATSASDRNHDIVSHQQLFDNRNVTNSQSQHVQPHGASAASLLTPNGKKASPTFSLETPPAGDFDWDERVRDPANNRFIDGMASLTGGSSRGYMGVASGAALLRLADDSSADVEGDASNQISDEYVNAAQNIPSTMFSLSQLEPFVDAYFQTYHISYPIIHEATFRAQFMEVIPRPNGNSWQVLLYIVAALGSFAASEVMPEIDVALFEAAKARMSIDMLETGNIVLVQALTLISNYVQKRNKPNSGYNYVGLALRMAMGLGLHKEFPAWHSKPLMLEMRRRVWWCMYIFNVGAVITFSRPLDLPRDGVEVQLPLNVHDSEVTASSRKLSAQAQETTLYTHVRCQSQFHLATCGIYEKIISNPPTAAEMLMLDDANLERWRKDLPLWFSEGTPQLPKFRLCHAILQWRWRNFRILMYRPYLMRRFMTKGSGDQYDPRNGSSQSEEQAVRRCLDTALETVELITNYWRHEKRNVLACWYALYFLFQAILIPVICLRNEPHSPSAITWRDQILNALDAINNMSGLNSAASRCHTTIVKLCGAYLSQDVSQWESPTHESPQTQLNGIFSFMFPMTDPQLPGGYDLALQETSTFDFMNYFDTL